MILCDRPGEQASSHLWQLRLRGARRRTFLGQSLIFPPLPPLARGSNWIGPISIVAIHRTSAQFEERCRPIEIAQRNDCVIRRRHGRFGNWSTPAARWELERIGMSEGSHAGPPWLTKPFKLTVSVTAKCNLACRHCYTD